MNGLPYLRAFALYLIIFTQMLDTSVTALALTNIASDLAIDVYYASWIMTSFGTGLVISFPLGNMLTGRYTTDWVLTLGCLVFILASFVCGVTFDAHVFIVARFVQGLSAGMAVIAAFPIMTAVVGKPREALGIALITSAVSLAPVAGPMVGALITEHFHWHWLFLINVPLVATSLLLLLPGFDLSRTGSADLRGRLQTLLLFGGFVMAVQYTIEFGVQSGWLRSPVIRFSLALAAVCCVLFWYRNRRHTILDLTVFRNLSYAVTTAVLAVGNGLIFLSVVMLPLWLRLDRHYSILQAGLIVAIASAVAAIATPFVGRFLPRRVFGWSAAVSLFFLAWSFLLMGLFTVDSGRQEIVIARLVAGLGLAVFTTPLLALSLMALKPEQSINGNAVSIVLRILASNLFTAIGFIAFKHLSTVHREQFIANTDRITALKSIDLEPGWDLLAPTFRTLALTDLFVATALVFAIGIVVMLPVMRRLRL